MVSALIDGGTASNAAIGASAGVLKFTNILRVVIRDVTERRTANKMMQDRRVDVTVFQECPVVGAYMVCCVPASVMVNNLFQRFWEAGWKGDVERTVKHHVKPLQAQAQRVALAHRFEIAELQNLPGLMKRNEKKLKEMQKRMGKTGMVGLDASTAPPAPPPLPGV